MDFKALISDRLNTETATLKLSFCYLVINYALSHNDLLLKYLVRSNESKMLSDTVAAKLKTELQKKKARLLADNEVVVGHHHYKLKWLAADAAADNLMCFSDRNTSSGLKVCTYIGSRDDLITVEEELILRHLRAEVLSHLATAVAAATKKQPLTSKTSSSHNLIGSNSTGGNDSGGHNQALGSRGRSISVGSSAVIRSNNNNNSNSNNNSNRQHHSVRIERLADNSQYNCPAVSFMISKLGSEIIVSPVANRHDVNSSLVQYIWNSQRPEVIVKMWRQQPLLEYHHIITTAPSIRLNKLVLLPLAEDLAANHSSANHSIDSQVSRLEIPLLD